MPGVQKMIARLPFAPIVAALFALVAVILVVATPQWLFERGVTASGLPGVMSAATPPLGEKARIAAAVAAGLGTGLVLWLMLLIAGKAGKPAKKRAEPVRGSELVAEDAGEADEPYAGPAHRRPIFAERDLGAPLMSDEAMEQALDELVLEAPVSEIAPEAEPLPVAAEPASEVAAEWPLPVADVESPEVAAEETVLPEAVVAPIRPVSQESVPALLDRLEAAMSRRQERGLPPLADVASLRKALGSGRARF